MKLLLITLLSLLPVLLAAQQTPLFTLLNEKQTGVSFLNKIIEDDSLNIFRYEYLYNGAGVVI